MDEDVVFFLAFGVSVFVFCGFSVCVQAHEVVENSSRYRAQLACWLVQ